MRRRRRPIRAGIALKVAAGGGSGGNGFWAGTNGQWSCTPGNNGNWGGLPGYNGDPIYLSGPVGGSSGGGDVKTGYTTGGDIPEKANTEYGSDDPVDYDQQQIVKDRLYRELDGLAITEGRQGLNDAQKTRRGDVVGVLRLIESGRVAVTKNEDLASDGTSSGNEQLKNLYQSLLRPNGPGLNALDTVAAFFNRLADGVEGAMNMVGDAIILDGTIPYLYNFFAYGPKYAGPMTALMQQDVMNKYKEGLKQFWSDFTYGLKTIGDGKAYEALKGDYEKDPNGFVGRMLADALTTWQTWRQFTRPKKGAPGVESEKPASPVKAEPTKPALTSPIKTPGQRPIGIGCFPAGTMLQTPLGNQRIETLNVGDTVLTRDENDPEAPWKEGKVVATVRRTAPLWRLVVKDKEILTTGEHPFWVEGQGWVDAKSIRVNDHLRTLTGEVVVEVSESTGEVAEVFNVSIEPSHTYFVGGDDWGFVVWSHNTGVLGSDGCFQTSPVPAKPVAPSRLPKVRNAKWGAVVEHGETAMDHIRKGHFYDSRPGQQSSRFSQANSTPGRVKSLVQEAVAKGEHSINSRGQTSVRHTFEEVIGTDINGRKTKTLQIFIDDEGNVVNVFPVR